MEMTGDVDVPVVGHMDKRVLVGVGGVAVAFVGWKWWQSRKQAAAYDPAADGVDPGMQDPGVLPSVAGAVSPDNSYGLPNGQAPSTDDFGFHGTTNSQWTQYVSTRLSQSDRWSYTDIVSALGAFTTNKPLSKSQQDIVQAAIAEAGYPPEGSHVIIPGGDVPLTVAPSGLSASAITNTTATLKWSPLAGATHYRIYRKDLGLETVGESNDPLWMARGLQPGRSYQFEVAGVTGSGKNGPMSGFVTVKTKAQSLAAPKGLKASSTATTASLSWSGVSGVGLYRIYRSDLGAESVGDSRDTRWQARGLAKNHHYTFRVVAVDNNGVNGPAATVSVTTKKK